MFFAGFLFLLIQQTFLIGADKHGYGGKLFRFKAHGLASVGEILLPRDIIIFTFMTIDKCLHNLLCLLNKILFTIKCMVGEEQQEGLGF